MTVNLTKTNMPVTARKLAAAKSEPASGVRPRLRNWRLAVGVCVLCWLGVAGSAQAACAPLLDRTVLRLQDEKQQSLCQYSGKVILVVNTASQCGYTPQYEGLEALQARYRDRGVVVLGFPSNDFGGQEPGSNRDIAEFCSNQFAVTFPMFAKGAVRGREAQPLYADLKRLTGQAPGWNFHKYLIDRKGEVVRSFASDVEPLSGVLTREIDRLAGEANERDKRRTP